MSLDSHISYSSPNRHDTAEAHGEPLGEEEADRVVAAAIEQLGR